MSALPPTLSGCDQYLVQYGKSGGLGCFLAESPLQLRRGTHVLVETPRGSEIGIALRPATLLQARLLGAVASGTLHRPLQASEVAEHASRAESVFREIRGLLHQIETHLEVLDLDLCFGQDRAILHVIAAADLDLTPHVRSVAETFGLELRIENLAAPTPVAEEEESHGCGKPDCGKTEGDSGGCSSCSTGGGCGSGCGSGSVDWQSYFADLRQRMPNDRRPLL
jgi:hypothetical protein